MTSCRNARPSIGDGDRERGGTSSGKPIMASNGSPCYDLSNSNFWWTYSVVLIANIILVKSPYHLKVFRFPSPISKNHTKGFVGSSNCFWSHYSQRASTEGWGLNFAKFSPHHHTRHLSPVNSFFSLAHSYSSIPRFVSGRLLDSFSVTSKSSVESKSIPSSCPTVVTLSAVS
jgi:hypothetical protein